MLQYLPMTVSVLLLGGECTGKTTLADGLTQALRGSESKRPVTIVPEVVRDFVARSKRLPAQNEQEEILSTQQRLLDDAIAASPANGVVICDPAPIMTAVYSFQYFNDDSLVASALVGMESAAERSRMLVVWCSPDIPWQADGIQREGPQARAQTHELIGTQVVPAIASLPVVVSLGTPADRVAQLLPQLT
ncbi:MAG: ATP-binding protein [Actinomycetales bacterium]|nr:ATP-binding protein [Actinomycetales bacterium]